VTVPINRHIAGQLVRWLQILPAGIPTGLLVRMWANGGRMGSGHVNCPIFRARLLKFSQNYGLSECFQGGKYCGWQRIFRGKYQKKWYLPNSSLVGLEVIANKYICIRVLHSGCNLEVNGQITIVSKYLLFLKRVKTPAF
jgi:hypothetical protein